MLRINFLLLPSMLSDVVGIRPILVNGCRPISGRIICGVFSRCSWQLSAETIGLVARDYRSTDETYERGTISAGQSISASWQRLPADVYGTRGDKSAQ